MARKHQATNVPTVLTVATHESLQMLLAGLATKLIKTITNIEIQQ
jgi:hypothetical protein